MRVRVGAFKRIEHTVDWRLRRCRVDFAEQRSISPFPCNRPRDRLPPISAGEPGCDGGRSSQDSGAGGMAARRDRVRRIGVLMSLASDDAEGKARNAALLQGLGRLGWIVGRSVWMEYRWAAGNSDNPIISDG